MPTYKLTYFNSRGRAELSRLLFALAGVEYTDNRIKPEQWPTLKPNTPLGQLPVLTEDGKEYTNSTAIEKHLARTFGLDGKTEDDKTNCDIVLGLRVDTLAELIKVVYEKDETKKKEACKTFGDTQMKKFITFIEKMLAKGGGKYIVGDKVTIADLAVFSMMEFMADVPGLEPLEVSQAVKAHFEMIKAIPNIQKWLKVRPEDPK